MIAVIITKRLFVTGTDANGQPLITDSAAPGEVYSYITIQEKARKGQRFRPVTLNDTGAFYKSFELEIQPDLILIKADYQKGSDHIGENFMFSYGSTEAFEKAISALNEFEFQDCQKYLIRF